MRKKRDFNAAWKKDTMTTNIYTTGQPRSGSTWLGRMLGDALDSPLLGHNREDHDVPEYFGEGRDGGYVIRKTHAFIKYGSPTVFIERDPRDIAVSRYFYRGEGQPIRGVIKTMWNAKIPYDDWIYRALDAEFEAYTSYESLHSKKGKELVLTFFKLGFIEPMGISTHPLIEKCDAAFENQTISAITKRHGDRFVGSVRKGIVGDWKNHFTRSDAEYMHEHFGEFMIERGYIKDDSWIEEVE